MRTARARALSVVSNLFFFSYPPHLLSVFFFFSPPMHSDQDFDDDDADCLYSQPPPESQSGSVLNLDYDDGRAVDTQSTQHMPRPPLRSKPAMYFSGHHSAVGSEFGFLNPPLVFAPILMLLPTCRAQLCAPLSTLQSHNLIRARRTLLLTHQTFLRTSSRHFLSLNFTKIQSTADSSIIMPNCAKHSLSTSEGISQRLVSCRAMSQISIQVRKFLLPFFLAFANLS